MRHGTVFAGIEIPGIVFNLHSHFLNFLYQNIITFLTLRPADHFPDTRHQNIHRGNSPAVIVQPHIESLDFFGVVANDNRAFEMGFGEVALVFGLHIDTEFRFIFKFVSGFLHDIDCLGISDAGKTVVNDVLQFGNQPRFDKLVKQRQIIRAFVHHMLDAGAHHIFSQIHIVINVGKSHFRLNHPKFRSVAGGVGILGAECWAEGINISQTQRIHFAVQLTGNRQMGSFSEKVLAVVNRTVGQFGHIVQIQSGDLKHFAGTLAVRTGDNRRMDIAETAVVKKFVYGKRQFRTNTESRTVFVGARPQMSNRPQIFVGVFLFLQGEVIRCQRINFNFSGNNFIFLIAALGFNQGAGYRQRRTGGDFFDFFIVA